MSDLPTWSGATSEVQVLYFYGTGEAVGRARHVTAIPTPIAFTVKRSTMTVSEWPVFPQATVMSWSTWHYPDWQTPTWRVPAATHLAVGVQSVTPDVRCFSFVEAWHTLASAETSCMIEVCLCDLHPFRFYFLQRSLHQQNRSTCSCGDCCDSSAHHAKSGAS